MKNTEYNKEEYREKKKQERKETYDLLDKETANCQSDVEALDLYLHVASRFDQYSVSNCLLIAAQMPTATLLKPLRQWKEEKVSVSFTQKGIRLIERGRPIQSEGDREGHFWDVKTVYDITQTSAPMTEGKKETLNVGETSTIIAGMAPCSIDVVAEDEPGEKLAWFDESKDVILIRHTGDEQERLAALTVAVSKATLYHDEDRYKNEDFLALCAGHILCHRYGISTDSIPLEAIPKEIKEQNATYMRQDLRIIRKTVFAMEQQLEITERDRQARKAAVR